MKQLFGPKPSGDEIVPIQVEYGESVPSELLKKRKRGRPSRDNEVRACDDVVKDIVVVKEVVEDRDKEIFKEDGRNGVNLEALSSLEDPYDGELTRRTENLKTEEQVLGYLGELNGKWGTWRRKKKIVDASEFGDALPKGWRLLVSIRKKQGRVWLYVSRYISPNGQQFMSWKEVSPYLLSLFGLPNSNQTNFGQSNENMQLTCKMAIGNAADIAVKDRNKGGELVSYSPAVITHLTNDHDKQHTSEVGNSGENQMGAILKCKKCTMTFTEKDDLMQHQLSSHRRRRSRLGTSVTDGVIIKGGQYECQFCHKTFDERHRYNGHVGAHIRHHMKSDEASPGVPSMQNSVGPLPVTPKESTIQTSADDEDDAMTLSAETDNVLMPASPESRCEAGTDIESCAEVKVLSGDEQDTKSDFSRGNFGEECRVQVNTDNKMNNCVGSVDQASDVVTAKFNSCLNSEVAKVDNENNIIGESAANRSTDSAIEQERILESRLCSPFASEKTCDADNVNRESNIVEEPNKKACSESVLLAPNHIEEASGIGNTEDVNITSPMGCPEPDVTNFDCKLSGYEQNCGVKSDVCNIAANKMETQPKLDEVQTYRNNELGFGTHPRRLDTQEMSLEFGSLVLPGNEKTFVEGIVNGNCNITVGLQKQKGSFSNDFLNQSCTGNTIGDFYTTSTIEDPKPDEVQNSSNSGLILAFGNNDTGIVADGMDNGPIEQTFRFENDLSLENSRIGKDPKEESSLFSSSCYSRVGADENNMDRVSTGRVWEGPMINEGGNSGPDNLMIGFGNNSQSVGDVIPGYMWRSDGGNILQSTLVDTSTQMEQSSGCYPTFNLFSDKGENELFGVSGKYDSMLGFEGAQSGHIEPVEFSFLTTQNLSSLQGDSKALSYNTEVGPGFDSSFWLEKDALSLNTAARNLVTSVCIWCTNEFHHDSVNPGTQTGAIGTVCPACSAKVSQQFNFF